MHKDITPDDSVVPVYEIVGQEIIIEPPEYKNPDDMIKQHVILKDSAISKLTKLGLTEDEAKAIIGNI